MKHRRYSEFEAAINAHPEAKAAIPLRTRMRYKAGDVPRSIRVLFDYPEVFATLAELLAASDTCTQDTDTGLAPQAIKTLAAADHDNAPAR